MINEDNEILNEIEEIKNSNPIIDFIFTPITDSIYLNNKIIYLEY